MKRFILIITSISMLILLASCGSSGERCGTDEIINDMINAFDPDSEEQSKEYGKLLSELRSANDEKAELWDDILDYWSYAHREMQINIGRLPENLPNGDNLAIVVLGFELNDDGTMQPELIGRLETAIACAEEYPDAYVVCTGGGTASGNRDVTEAGQMGDWLLAAGLDEERLIIENRSLSTVENALFTYEIFEDRYPQIDSVAIVSSSYHISWGSLLFQAVFLKTTAERGSNEINVISNAAYRTENEKYKDVIRYERGGLTQIAGT